MKNKSLFMISLLGSCVWLSISACNPLNDSPSFDYGTQNDSARFYYLKGFHEILDNGRWTEAEKAYRKALEFDPDYALGKSLVGRITRNVVEREIILQELQKAQEQVGADEKLLLEVYLLSIEAYNNRDKEIKAAPDFHAQRRQLAEANFRQFVHTYPEDDYVKAEYIEWLHAMYGPQRALDSLKSLASERQMKLGFYISYAASLELELGNLQNAIAHANELEALMLDSTYTSYLRLKAEMYLAQDSLLKAKECIDQVVKRDSNHLIARGMQADIEERLRTP